MFSRYLVLSLTLALGVAPWCRAADQAADGSTEAGVRQIVTTVQDAFNRRDAKALAACWTPDGEFVGPAGNRVTGRQRIESAFDAYLAAHQDHKLRLGIASWRPVADNVVLVDMMTEMTPAPEGLPSEPVSTMVLVNHDGAWKISALYELLTGVPSHRLELKKLQWLVGHWTEGNDESAGALSRTTCDWNSSGQYLIRKFPSRAEGSAPLSGTEIIGWDPRARRIRSWSFEADGTFGESTWTRDGERWVIRHQGTLANGGDLSVTYLVTLADADTLSIVAQDRLINGERQPAIPEVTLKRVAAVAEPKTAPAAAPKTLLPQDR